MRRGQRPTLLGSVGDAYDNALCESFFATLEGELLDRRRVLHFNVTEHPTAAWTAQPIVDAFPDDPAPSSLLRDRDRIDGHPFPRGTRRPPGSIQRIPTPSTAPKRGGSRLKRARYISDERRIVGSGQDQIV